MNDFLRDRALAGRQYDARNELSEQRLEKVDAHIMVKKNKYEPDENKKKKRTDVAGTRIL